jgi:Flp pilus assembly protein TadG
MGGVMLRLLKRFARSTRGVLTIEFVIWIPIFMVILAFTADACKLYLTQADMWDVARDTARRISTGQYCNNVDAESYARAQLLYPLTYRFSIVKGASDVVEISTPVAGASVFGALANFGGFAANTLSAKVTMPAEPGACSS